LIQPRATSNSGGYQAAHRYGRFIQNCRPHWCAFNHAGEITEADLLLHMVDISHPNALKPISIGSENIGKIGAGHIPRHGIK